jgi:hypothetical protein
LALYVDDTNNGDDAMTFQTRQDARREQMLRELSSDLADMVEAGDLTDAQANEWLAAKADQWAAEG